MDEEKYDEILEHVRDRFWEMSENQRRRYIFAILKKMTGGDEDELKELFEIGKKRGDIPKKLKYSYENLIEAILNATNLMGLDNFDV